MQAQAIYGNAPPAQPAWQDPDTAYGGTTPYSHLGGGLKRFRVAKNKGGVWVNTWMDADVRVRCVDAQYRDISDYVFAPLDYAHSRTCCWDSTDGAMYQIIMDDANAQEADAQANQTCVAPFAQYAS